MASYVARMPTRDLCSTAIAARRNQSQIVDRWDTIATIERQSHEAELSALSNVRASSLIQMWREMEAEASPQGRAALLGAEEAGGWSDSENEKERRGVKKMVRTMSLKIPSWASSSSDESELLTVAKERLDNRPTPAILSSVVGRGKVVRVRGRKEMEGLVMRMKQERLREIAELAEEKKVSRFPFRGKIQPLIRLRSLRQEDAAIKDNQQRSKKFESEKFQRGSNSTFFRKIAEDSTSQHNASEIGSEEQHTNDSQNSVYGNSANHSETEEFAAAIELENLPESFFASFSIAENLQEKTDASLNERKSFQREILMEETDDWLAEQTFTNNGEIRDLLERKTVSNCLAGDFSHKLNQLIMSFMQKQALHYVNGRDECGEEAIWRQNYGDCSDQDPSASFSQNSSAIEQEEDVINDLRDGFAHIQSELSELRKLVESCLEWQKKIDFSFKNESSSSVHQLVERGKSSPKTKWNGICWICCEAQIDTVLYRCGHMCACFKCSQGLQYSSVNCPICQSTIIDVVRAYPYI